MLGDKSVLVGPLLSRQPELRVWARITPWFVLFAVVNIVWQITFRTTGWVLPGWGQRIAFAGFFLWPAFTGMRLWQLSSRYARRVPMLARPDGK